jgi:anti-sigma factor RsiW
VLRRLIRSVTGAYRHRSVRTLTVHRRTDEWEVTPAGRCACTIHGSYLEEFYGVGAARSVLEPLSPDTLIGPVVLAGASVHEVQPPAPDGVIETVQKPLAPRISDHGCS